MKPHTPEITIPPDILQKWQRVADLVANIMHVPSGVLCKLEPPYYTHYRIVASSDTQGNPFPIDDTFSMDMGTFCEEVIQSRQLLLVVDARGEDRWRLAPELNVGMVSYLGVPIVWPDGRMFGTICVLDNKGNRYSEPYQELLIHCRDVIEADLHTLLRLDAELDDQKAHLKELFTRTPEAIVMINSELVVARVNPGFTRVFGYTAEEAVGRSIDELIEPEELRKNAARLYEVFRTGESFAAMIVGRRKNGTHVPVSFICVPVPSNGDEKVGYVIYRDLTDAKRLEDEQRRNHEIQLELVNANRVATLGQLSAAIAHELSQPMTGIITNCNTCLRKLSDGLNNLDGVREVVRRTLRDGERAMQVIVRLRALFSNKEPMLEPVDLNEATREVIALSSSEIQTGRVILRTKLENDLPLISVDRIQIQQVILNLVKNALDAMNEIDDRPRDLLISTFEADDGSVQLDVADSGVGFDPQKMNRMFEVFYTTKNEGMGVGLAVSRSIINIHNGRLWAVLNNGPGATFSISVPGAKDHCL